MNQNMNTLMEKMMERGIARQRISLPPIEETKELLPPSEDLSGTKNVSESEASCSIRRGGYWAERSVEPS